tara:strand:+ start:1169 stop:1660 length:492 start_codon:yes stop_codon:yes gene_type:complete
MDKKQFFKIKPTKENQVICKELWENVLKNKKKVIFSLETVYNTGEFKLHINKSEYEKIKNSNYITINDYTFELIHLSINNDMYLDIENKNNYSKEELDDIDNLIYGCDKSKEDLLKQDGIIEEDIEDMLDDIIFSEKKIILNNWKLKDTIYKIDSPVNLHISH